MCLFRPGITKNGAAAAGVISAAADGPGEHNSTASTPISRQSFAQIKSSTGGRLGSFGGQP